VVFESVQLYVSHFDKPPPQSQRLKQIFDIEIISVETTMEVYIFQSFRLNPTDTAIPDFP